MTAHSVRPHQFSNVRTYVARNDGLAVRDGANEKLIPYAEITSIRLIAYPSFYSQHMQCTIATSARPKEVVRSHHFVSMGEFEDRSATYAPFVLELCRRTHDANKQARFIWGSGGLRIAWLVVLLIAAIGWAIWIAAVYEGAVSTWQAVSALVLLTLGSVLSYRSVKGNAVASFDPLEPPVT